MIEQVLKYLKNMFNKPVPDPQTPKLDDPPPLPAPEPDEEHNAESKVPDAKPDAPVTSETPLGNPTPKMEELGGSGVMMPTFTVAEEPVPDPPSYQQKVAERQARVQDKSADEDALRHMRLGKWMTDDQQARIRDLGERFRDDNQLVDASQNRNEETQEWTRAMWGKQLDFDTRVAADIANLYRRMEWITSHFESQIDSLSDTNV